MTGMVMARLEMANCDTASIGQGADAATVFYQLGLRCAADGNGSADLIAAHKWFNLAATKGCREAIQLRQEIAAHLSPSEIAAAQRAARDWLMTH
jgi:hypothetical protein